MKLLMPVLLAGLLLVGCEKIEGQLNITKDLKLKNKQGDTHLLRVGTYSADIKANTSKKITLRLNNDSEEKFIFNHNGNIPTNGSFNIPSNVSGQPVDLSGTVATNVTRSAIKEGYQSCTYEMPVQTCFPMPNGGVNCSVYYRTVNGSQWIRYYDEQTVKNVALSVKAANSTEESADFHGDITLVDRIITNQTQCR